MEILLTASMSLTSQLWITLTSKITRYSIEAGWQVSRELYGDNNTYWTSDAYKATGCYNLLCCYDFIALEQASPLFPSIALPNIISASWFGRKMQLLV
ncbi:hypothetical protein VIGAN_08176600 [Vigna angularis var. angularis]|uniref:Neprosin PEP catalytic domain-containing protein n=1 Tax=Vigna angularis var. angularis TaxID=157739 RepID=A0A0S3SQG8_PHAAN|nr:hypothetical protein VIGAN_08176600 [Vigna angularis var. angularis]